MRGRVVVLPGRLAVLLILRAIGCGVTLLSAEVAETNPPYDFIANGVQSARVALRNGMPVLLINDQPVPPLLFFYNSEFDYDNRKQYLQAQVQMAAVAGIHVLSMPFRPWPWEGGTPDYTFPDSIMDRYLAVDPHAVFLLRSNVSPGMDWVPSPPLTPDDDILYMDGSRYPISPASETYHQGFLRSFRATVRHYEASPYAPHIVGYHIGGQTTDEWFPEGYREKGLDYSPVNYSAFRAWLRAKYVTDAALSQAWGTTVTLDGAGIPVPNAGRFPIAGAAPGAAVDAFYRFPQEQDWVDYSEYISDLISGRILDIARVAKEETNGKKLTAFFHGYIHALPASMNGHLRLGRLLASPAVDIVASPISYEPLTERLGGGVAGSSGPIDSVALKGKLWMNEDDTRTWLSAANPLPECCFPGMPPTKTLEETFNVLQRNLASAVIHRSGTWWMDLNANGAYQDAALWHVMSDMGLPRFDELYASPASYRPEVALITDAASVAFEKSDWDLFDHGRPLLRNALAKTGAQFGYYSLEDFLDGTLPSCKVYIFANAWYLTDAQIALIRQRLQAERATAVWQYAAGYLGPAGPSAQRMEALTGIRVRVSNGIPSTKGAGLLQGLAWGWGGSNVLSPRFVAEDADAAVLGRYWADDLPSTVLKRVDGWNSVMVADIGWSADLLRRLLEDLGVRMWSDLGDTVHTDGRLLVLHSGKPGTRSIQLPAGVEARSLEGQVLARAPDPLRVTFGQTGETQWFRLATASSTRFYTLPPCRAFDTRRATGPDAGAPSLVAGGTRTLTTTGRCGIPATAKALSVNMTITGPVAPGFLTLYPADSASPPLASNINFQPGQTRANNAIVLLAADATGIKVLNGSAGTADFILDVNGYFE